MRERIQQPSPDGGHSSTCREGKEASSRDEVGEAGTVWRALDSVYMKGDGNGDNLRILLTNRLLRRPVYLHV